MSKVTGVSLARIATLVLAGGRLADLRAAGVAAGRPAALPAPALHEREGGRAAVRSVPGGRHRARTGDEVDRRGDGDRRRSRAWRSRRRWSRRGTRCPTRGHGLRVASRTATSGRSCSRRSAWSDMGFRLARDRGTAGVLERAGIAVDAVAKVCEGPDNVAELIRRAGSTWSSTRRSDAARAPTATSSAPRRPRRACRASRRSPACSRRSAGSRRSAATRPSRARSRSTTTRRGRRRCRRASRSSEAATRTAEGERVKRVRAEILSTRKLGAYQLLTLVAPEIAERARPGQFLAVAMPEGRDFLLRRHFAIHQASRRGGWAGTLEFVVDPVGARDRAGSRASQGPRVPRRDRPARQGVLVSEATHELPAGRRGARRGRRCTSWRRSCSRATSASTW